MTTERQSILILAHNYGMQFVEGCNQYAQLFDPKRYKVTVAYLIGEFDPETQRKTLAEQVVFFNFPRKAIRGLKIRAISEVMRFCRKEQFQTVICHRYKPSYIMMWIARFYDIPHVYFVMHAIQTMRAKSRRLLAALLYRPNMHFIGVSKAVQADLQKDMWRVPKKNIHTFYNIIDHQSFEPQILSRENARLQLHASQNAFVFGTIGRFVKEKDQHNLIRAFALIRHQLKDSQLIFVGDGKLEADLKHLCRELQIEKDVIFTGFIPDGFRFMKAFDVFILNSIEEAFGRVLLEAMLAHVPIIATETDGIPEVMGQTGIMIPKKDPEKLAEAMLSTYLMPAETLKMHGDLGYERVRKEFSIEHFKHIFEETFPYSMEVS